MFKRLMMVLVYSLLLAAVTGCASINSVSLTPIPANRTKAVRAEVSKTIFLGFNFDNDYINPLVDDLKRQCPNGVVSGILTKDETTSYLIVFNKRITATGFCNTSSIAKGGMPQRAPSAQDKPEPAQ